MAVWQMADQPPGSPQSVPSPQSASIHPRHDELGLPTLPAHSGRGHWEGWVRVAQHGSSLALIARPGLVLGLSVRLLAVCRWDEAA